MICPCSIYSEDNIVDINNDDNETYTADSFSNDTFSGLSYGPDYSAGQLGSHCHGDILETGLNLAILVILVWFLNRELEIRLSF